MAHILKWQLDPDCVIKDSKPQWFGLMDSAKMWGIKLLANNFWEMNILILMQLDMTQK